MDEAELSITSGYAFFQPDPASVSTILIRRSRENHKAIIASNLASKRHSPSIRRLNAEGGYDEARGSS